MGRSRDCRRLHLEDENGENSTEQPSISTRRLCPCSGESPPSSRARKHPSQKISKIRPTHRHGTHPLRPRAYLGHPNRPNLTLPSLVPHAGANAWHAWGRCAAPRAQRRHQAMACSAPFHREAESCVMGHRAGRCGQFWSYPGPQNMSRVSSARWWGAMGWAVRICCILRAGTMSVPCSSAESTPRPILGVSLSCGCMVSI